MIAKYILTRELVVFQISDKCSHALAGLIDKASGEGSVVSSQKTVFPLNYIVLL